MKKLIVLCLAAVLAFSQTGCNRAAYFDDSVRAAEKVGEIGGATELTLAETDSELLLENENVRLILNKRSGSIRELANKETGVYLLRDADGEIPLVLEYREGQFAYGFHAASYTVTADTAERIAVRYVWSYARGLRVESEISLSRHGSEVVFSLDLYNNREADSVLSIEYPYLDGVGRLYSAATDKLFHSYATGYVFDDPVALFNRDDFNGIQWYMGLYPYGFGSTMQMMSYYVEDYGGFHFQTYDRGYTIKSFTAVGNGDGLRLGIRHYLDDLGSQDAHFYEIGIGNLTQGRWTESCDRYRAFAVDCPWSQKQAKLIDRTPEARAFYENTTLVNFAPHIGKAFSAWQDWNNIYELYRAHVGGGKMLNVIGNDWQRISTAGQMNGEMETFFPAVVDGESYAQMKREDYTAFFEFNNLYNVNGDAEMRPLRVAQATKDRNGNVQILQDTVDPGIAWRYMCPSEDWYDFAKAKTDVFTDEYDADFLYHDCGYCVAPRTCFDTSHAHGTRVNIIEDEIAFLDRLGAESGRVIGEELISEVFVGTVGFYQARANAGGMGFMDINDIRVAVEANAARKVSAFDYIYREYGILRTDGYMKPLKESGDMYYAVMAFTALNGGVPQFNYEYLKASFNADEIQPEMLDYLDKLARLKTGPAKNYLVYGQMLPPVDTGAGTVACDYLNTSAIGETVFRGTAVVDRVVSASYRYQDRVGILLGNVTDARLDLKFVVNAERDFGISSGEIRLGGRRIAKIKNGKAYVKLKLAARDVALLEAV